jgi:hypothetical protein
MATQFGEDGEWGMTAQSGIVSDSTSYNFTSDNKMIRGVDGEVAGKTYYAGRMEATLSGYIPSATPWSLAVADVATLTLSPDSLSIGTLGSHIVESVTQTYSNEDYARIEARTVSHDGLT